MTAPIHRWIRDEDREHFQSHGYLPIRNVVPRHLTQNAARDIAAFVHADLDDSRTWYRNAPQNDGVVPMHQSQSLWDIRQCPNLHEVFSDFWGNHRLMVDINRCVFRPPRHPDWPTLSHGDIHWDTDPRQSGEASLQCVVLLTDIARDGGGFQCAPEVYQNLEAWLDRHARGKNFNFLKPGLKDGPTTQIEGKAGDIILWSSKLPHGSAVNLSPRPRIASFVSMQPPPDSPALRASMKKWWLSKQAPEWWRGLPGQLETEPGPPAILSPLPIMVECIM